MPELNDFERGHILYGWDGSAFIPILVGPDGDLFIIAKGQDSGGTLRALRVDTDGQLVMVPRGQTGNWMLVDSDGYLTMIVKGDSGGGTLKTVAVDTDGQLVMVPRGQAGNYLDVDSDGYLTTVIKGQGDAGLQTVALDDEGRLNAFIYDTIDAWGQVASVGLAELAARLGSVVRYERSGQVSFIDGFENGLSHWETVLGGTGSEVVHEARYFQSGGYSCFLKSGSTDPWNAQIRYRVGGMPAGRVGYAVSFSQGSVGDELTFEMYFRDGAVEHEIHVRWSDALLKLQVYEKDTGWTTIDGPKLAYRGARCFNTLKLVADLTTDKYVRVRLNTYVVDLTDWDIKTSVDLATPGVDFFITNKGNAGQNDYVWVDDIILTYAEP